VGEGAAVARRRLVLDDDSLDEAELDMVSVDPVLCSVCCCWCALVLDAAPEEGFWEEPCLDAEARWWVDDDEAAARSSASLCLVCSLLLLRPWEVRPEADAEAAALPLALALEVEVPLTGRRDDETWLEWPAMPSGTMRRARGSGATTSEDAAATCIPP
jgi:hypothetical protein